MFDMVQYALHFTFVKYNELITCLLCKKCYLYTDTITIIII